jgi:hypothetical protein
MSMASGGRWQDPDVEVGYRARQDGRAAADMFPPASWWFVTWRARVLDESTGDVQARLAEVASALDQAAETGGRPAVRLLAPASVSIEFWFRAVSAREAFGGARAAIRRACRAAGVGDPAPLTTGDVDLMLMLEELPGLQQDDPNRSGE